MVVNLSLLIDHYPQKVFSFFDHFGPIISVNLNIAFIKQLKPHDKLTNALALKIFNRIKIHATILSFLTKPVVVISFSGAIAALGAGLLINGLVLTGLCICLLGIVLLGASIKSSRHGVLSELSQSYQKLSEKAASHSKTIQLSKGADLIFTFKTPPRF